jgi:hypothetical protein
MDREKRRRLTGLANSPDARSLLKKSEQRAQRAQRAQPRPEPRHEHVIYTPGSPERSAPSAPSAPSARSAPPTPGAAPSAPKKSAVAAMAPAPGAPGAPGAAKKGGGDDRAPPKLATVVMQAMKADEKRKREKNAAEELARAHRIALDAAEAVRKCEQEKAAIESLLDKARREEQTAKANEASANERVTRLGIEAQRENEKNAMRVAHLLEGLEECTSKLQEAERSEREAKMQLESAGVLLNAAAEQELAQLRQNEANGTLATSQAERLEECTANLRTAESEKRDAFQLVLEMTEEKEAALASLRHEQKNAILMQQAAQQAQEETARIKQEATARIQQEVWTAQEAAQRATEALETAQGEKKALTQEAVAAAQEAQEAARRASEAVAQAQEAQEEARLALIQAQQENARMQQEAQEAQAARRESIEAEKERIRQSEYAQNQLQVKQEELREAERKLLEQAQAAKNAIVVAAQYMDPVCEGRVEDCAEKRNNAKFTAALLLCDDRERAALQIDIKTAQSGDEALEIARTHLQSALRDDSGDLFKKMLSDMPAFAAASAADVVSFARETAMKRKLQKQLDDAVKQLADEKNAEVTRLKAELSTARTKERCETFLEEIRKDGLVRYWQSEEDNFEEELKKASFGSLMPITELEEWEKRIRGHTHTLIPSVLRNLREKCKIINEAASCKQCPADTALQTESLESVMRRITQHARRLHAESGATNGSASAFLREGNATLTMRVGVAKMAFSIPMADLHAVRYRKNAYLIPLHLYHLSRHKSSLFKALKMTREQENWRTWQIYCWTICTRWIKDTEQTKAYVYGHSSWYKHKQCAYKSRSFLTPVYESEWDGSVLIMLLNVINEAISELCGCREQCDECIDAYIRPKDIGRHMMGHTFPSGYHCTHCNEYDLLSEKIRLLLEDASQHATLEVKNGGEYTTPISFKTAEDYKAFDHVNLRLKPYIESAREAEKLYDDRMTRCVESQVEASRRREQQAWQREERRREQQAWQGEENEVIKNVFLKTGMPQSSKNIKLSLAARKDALRILPGILNQAQRLCDKKANHAAAEWQTLLRIVNGMNISNDEIEVCIWTLAVVINAALVDIGVDAIDVKELTDPSKQELMTIRLQTLIDIAGKRGSHEEKGSSASDYYYKQVAEFVEKQPKELAEYVEKPPQKSMWAWLRGS